MIARKLFILLMISLASTLSRAQLLEPKDTFTKADTLRGSDNENRDWWDVLRYEIYIKPDYYTKTLKGQCYITFKVLKPDSIMQIDLQDSLVIDYMGLSAPGHPPDFSACCLKFEKKDGVYLVKVPSTRAIEILAIGYHGKPREAVKPPWDGGWVWTKDSLGNPWMSVACQGLGASSWFPCKDIQSDEPDSGATLEISYPDSLFGVGNGREKTMYDINGDEISSVKNGISLWSVKNPINNYDIIPYIGKYTNFTDTLMGEAGKLDLSYWVLSYNLDRAKTQFAQVKPMLHCFEYWFGKYPFYKDSYKLVEAPYIGMEHQSAVAYGNGYRNGYHGADLSGTGWGLKWDYIIIHESGHEWFGNSITSKDLADQWIHESFTMYSEVLCTQWLFGKDAADDYCVGLRRDVLNDRPIIGPYGVNKEGSGDMYYKGANMIHSIRHIINNDSLFRQILRGLNTEFYHQTVTAKQIEDYIINMSGIDLQAMFNQYLTTTQIPQLVYSTDKTTSSITLRWTNCIEGFHMPITIPATSKRLDVTTGNTTVPLTKEEMRWFTKANLVRAYYIDIK